MNPECQNDCVEPLIFPRRPFNRPGLSHIAYRIGSYAEFREELLRRLNLDPLSARWTHREPDDPGIALLEGAAILGDILTFYQEHYANEAFLRTAQWRESVSELVRLLGYRLAPGMGGRATFAFEVKGPAPVTVPASFPVKVDLVSSETAADFETGSEIVAFPALSRFNLYRPWARPFIVKEQRVFSAETRFLKQNGMELNTKDRLMLVVNPAKSDTYRQIVVIEKVEERFDTTEFTIEGQWMGEDVANAVSAFKLGRSFRHFGYNGPPTSIKVVNGVAEEQTVSFVRNLDMLQARAGLAGAGSQPLASSSLAEQEDAAVQTPVKRVSGPSLLPSRMPLHLEVDDLSAGATMLALLHLSQNSNTAGEEHFFTRTISHVQKGSYRWGALSGGSTVITLDDTLAEERKTYADIRTIEFLEVVGAAFAVQGRYAAKAVADTRQLFFFGDFHSYQALDQRTLLFSKAGGIYEERLARVQSAPPDELLRLRPIDLSSPLAGLGLADFPLAKDGPVTVYGNVVQATQGKSENEGVLGNGDSSKSFQTFKLPKSPLTYLMAEGQTPPYSPEASIYVNDRLWARVPSFFGRTPKEEIYIIREDAQGDSYVQFGDGQTGARLPSGFDNVVAKYRTGHGAYGASKPDSKAQAGAKLERLDKIQMPGVASGGTTPEPAEKAREAAPGKIQSLGRLVSLRDYESEALSIPGVSKAAASWAIEANVPSLLVTLLMESGREVEFAKAAKVLANYDRCRGAQRFPIQPRAGRMRYVYLEAIFALDPTYREEVVRLAIRTALGTVAGASDSSNESTGLFSLRRRHFGETEYATRIEGVIQNVAGVQWAQVRALSLLPLGDDPAKLSPPVANAFLAVVPCGVDEVLQLFPAHLQLSAATGMALEECP